MKQPLGVKVVGGILVVGRILSLLGIILTAVQSGHQAAAVQTPISLWAVALGVGLLNLVLGIGFLMLQPWARAITLIVATLSLLSGTMDLALSGGKGG